MNPAFLLFFALVGVFGFTVFSFLRKSSQLREAQIAREQALLAAVLQNKKGQS